MSRKSAYSAGEWNQAGGDPCPGDPQSITSVGTFWKTQTSTYQGYADQMKSLVSTDGSAGLTVEATLGLLTSLARFLESSIKDFTTLSGVCSECGLWLKGLQDRSESELGDFLAAKQKTNQIQQVINDPSQMSMPGMDSLIQGHLEDAHAARDIASRALEQIRTEYTEGMSGYGARYVLRPVSERARIAGLDGAVVSGNPVLNQMLAGLAPVFARFEVDQSRTNDLLGKIKGAGGVNAVGYLFGALSWMGPGVYSQAEWRAAIAGLSDDDLKQFNDFLTNNGGDGPMIMANQLFNAASAVDVDRLHQFMPALEPGSKGDGWIKPPIDLSQRFQLKDVHQGAADDCWFNAGIGAIAGTRPGFLEKNIRQNPNGTYTVTFYKDDKPFETTVSGYLPYQNFKGRKIPYYSYGEDGQENKGWNWASVFEKARAAQPGSGTYDSLSGFSSAFGNKGVAPEGALELLTGQDADTIIVNDPAHGNHLAPLSPTEEQLKKAIDDHQPIAATRYTDGFPWDQNPGNPALVPYHVYIVTGVQNGKVTLANPWGPDGGNLKGTKIEGTVTISIDEFRSRFRDLAIGAKP